MKPGTKRIGGTRKGGYLSGQTYKGVLRNEKGEIIWECEHLHENRSNDTPYCPVSARTCAIKHLQETE